MSTTYPPPPPFYQLYTEEHSLDPPEPPSDSGNTFISFDESFPLVKQAQNLSDQATQLFPSDLTDLKSELKKLNRSLLFNFMELLRVAIKFPSKYLPKVTEIETIIINFKFLLEHYRDIEFSNKLKLEIQQRIKDLEAEIGSTVKLLNDTKSVTQLSKD
ncbi:hypothetical protein GEMRC1_004030 [Eukaryota sp. GEM-RC1]